MEGVNLFSLGSGYARLDPHRGCYLSHILRVFPYNQHYGRKPGRGSSSRPGAGVAGGSGVRG
jgi:hypothetical protein